MKNPSSSSSKTPDADQGDIQNLSKTIKVDVLGKI